MKKLFYLFASVAVIAACNGKDDPKDPDSNTGKQELVSMQITATNPFGWSKADKVSILDGTNNNLFRSQGAGESAVLAGDALSNTVLYGFTPYDQAATVADGAVLATVPASYVLTADKISGVAAGCSQDGKNMEFKALVGFLKITFASDAANITALSVSSANGEAIAGPVEIKFDGGFSAAAKGDVASVKATAFEESFKAGATYYVPVLPGTYANGFTVYYTFKGATNELPVAGPVTVTAGGNVDLATINRPLTATEKLLIGEWELSKYGSGSWLSSNLGEDRQVPGPCKGDIIRFNLDGTVTIDLGEDGVTYNITKDDIQSVELTGAETWSLLENDTVLRLSGNAFPLILGNDNGLVTDYTISRVSAAELVLEYLYTDSEGTPDVPFKVYLQPKGMKRMFHTFAKGDFGIEFDEENAGYAPEGGLQPLDVNGIKWTMEPETQCGGDVPYGWFAWGAMRVGAWGGDDSIKKLVFRTSDIKGNIKAVNMDVWHQDEYDPATQKAEFSVTVGGQNFGSKSTLLGESTGHSATSTEPASGEVVINVEVVLGNLALIIRNFEVVYQD